MCSHTPTSPFLPKISNLRPWTVSQSSTKSLINIYSLWSQAAWDTLLLQAGAQSFQCNYYHHRNDERMAVSLGTVMMIITFIGTCCSRNCADTHEVLDFTFIPRLAAGHDSHHWTGEKVEAQRRWITFSGSQSQEVVGQDGTPCSSEPSAQVLSPRATLHQWEALRLVGTQLLNEPARSNMWWQMRVKRM